MTTHSYGEFDDAYWEKWQEHYCATGRKEQLEGIHKDGIIDNDKFNNARTRILFVLKEPNHQKKTTKGGDIRCWLRGKQVGRAGSALRSNLARWAHAILNNFADDLTYGKRERQDSLLRTAVINLKKVEGGRSADMGIVGCYAGEDRQLLCKQIKEIKPDLIVAGGTFNILAKILRLAASCSKSAVASSEYNTWVIPMRHPSAPGRSEESWESLRKLVDPCFTAEGELRQC